MFDVFKVLLFCADGCRYTYWPKTLPMATKSKHALVASLLQIQENPAQADSKVMQEVTRKYRVGSETSLVSDGKQCPKRPPGRTNQRNAQARGGVRRGIRSWRRISNAVPRWVGGSLRAFRRAGFERYYSSAVSHSDLCCSVCSCLG